MGNIHWERLRWGHALTHTIRSMLEMHSKIDNIDKNWLSKSQYFQISQCFVSNKPIAVSLQFISYFVI